MHDRCSKIKSNSRKTLESGVLRVLLDNREVKMDEMRNCASLEVIQSCKLDQTAHRRLLIRFARLLATYRHTKSDNQIQMQNVVSWQ